MRAEDPGSKALYPKLPPGPHGSEPETVASNQRARLYGAMIELVATRGYQPSTVVALCALAGVSKRTLYERFPGGKQACFLGAYDIIVGRAAMHVLAGVPGGLEALASESPTARLRTLAQAFAAEVAAYPNAARLVLVEAFGVGPPALARTQRTEGQVERAIIWSLRESPDAPAPSRVVVTHIVAAGTNVVRARLLDGRVAKLARELPDVCVAAACGPSEPRPATPGAR